LLCYVFVILMTLMIEYNVKHSSVNKRTKDKETSSSVPFGRP
jgi:hypothetical protein